MKRSFSRVAIVNRGEAALRFIHAALELNREGERLHTIALYTEPDRRRALRARGGRGVGPRPGHGRGGRRAPEGRLRGPRAPGRGAPGHPGRGGLAGLGLRGRAAGVRRALRAARRHLHRPLARGHARARRQDREQAPGREPRPPGRPLGGRARGQRGRGGPAGGRAGLPRDGEGHGRHRRPRGEGRGDGGDAPLRPEGARGPRPGSGSAWPPCSWSGASTARGTWTSRC